MALRSISAIHSLSESAIPLSQTVEWGPLRFTQKHQKIKNIPTFIVDTSNRKIKFYEKTCFFAKKKTTTLLQPKEAKLCHHDPHVKP